MEIYTEPMLVWQVILMIAAFDMIKFVVTKIIN